MKEINWTVNFTILSSTNSYLGPGPDGQNIGPVTAEKIACPISSLRQTE
jgi:hypothetical protein